MKPSHVAPHPGPDHGSPLSDTEIRVRALETLLTEKGYVERAALDAIIEAYETKDRPACIGARVVAQAPGLDPAVQCRHCCADATQAINHARTTVGPGRRSSQWPSPDTPTHSINLVVCTLCSCYPWDDARPAARLVQVRAVPLARRHRPARRARRLRRHAAARNDEHPGLGLHRRDALSSSCRCAPRAPTAGPRNSSPALVTRDSMIGTGLVDPCVGGADHGRHS
jgi:nitrile hydratase